MLNMSEVYTGAQTYLQVLKIYRCSFVTGAHLLLVLNLVPVKSS